MTWQHYSMKNLVDSYILILLNIITKLPPVKKISLDVISVSDTQKMNEGVGDPFFPWSVYYYLFLLKQSSSSSKVQYHWGLLLVGLKLADLHTFQVWAGPNLKKPSIVQSLQTL